MKYKIGRKYGWLDRANRRIETVTLVGVHRDCTKPWNFGKEPMEYYVQFDNGEITMGYENNLLTEYIDSNGVKHKGGEE